ncbi:MAG: hypothetical protein RLZZ316_1816 [Bacteroidota bacterium]|jgi:hypothetical protein
MSLKVEEAAVLYQVKKNNSHLRFDEKKQTRIKKLLKKITWSDEQYQTFLAERKKLF